jgi:hypothetical protein
MSCPLAATITDVEGTRVWRSRVLLAAPELLAAAVAGFAVGPMFLLLTGHFSAALGVPLGLIGAAVGCALAGLADPAPDRRDLRFSAAAVVIVVLWFAYNVRYTAQDVYNTRDPSTYTITAEWLVHHGSLVIHTHNEIFGSPPGAQVGTTSFAMVAPNTLHAQGDHLLPVLLSLSGRMFGTATLLRTNTVLAAIALLVFFGLARRVVGSLLGLVALLALAVSMPYIYVGRDAYTEPLTMLCLMGALVFAHRGWTTRRPRDWAVCGLAAGASTCVRVDTYGALLGVVAAVTLYVAVASGERRRRAVQGAAALAAGAALPLALGYLDLSHLSRQYYGSQHANITHLIGLLALSALLSPLCVWLAWRTRVRSWLTSAVFARRAPQVAWVLLGVVFVLLASRPWWQTTHGPCYPDVANMQRVSGVGIDCTRSYNEQTLHWQAMYLGWPTVALAFAGYGVLATQLVRRRVHAYVGVLAMGASMSSLYLYTSQVSPDQPWAIRRYVPVVIPLFLIAAMAALRALWRRGGAGALAWRPVVAGLAATAVAFPLAVAWPMRHVREEHDQLAQLQAICKAVGKHGAVIYTDEQTVFGYGQSVRSFCNVPGIGLTAASAQTTEAAVDAVYAHGRIPYVMFQCPRDCARFGPAFYNVSVQRWPTLIDKTPDAPDMQQYAVWLFRVDPDHRMVAVPSVKPAP